MCLLWHILTQYSPGAKLNGLGYESVAIYLRALHSYEQVSVLYSA